MKESIKIAPAGLAKLNRYISQANKQIAGRYENITLSKVIAELTLFFGCHY